jgi:hypothetical protein
MQTHHQSQQTQQTQPISLQDLERQQTIDADMAEAQFKELEAALSNEKQARSLIEIELTNQTRVRFRCHDISKYFRYMWHYLSLIQELTIAKEEILRSKQHHISVLQERDAEIQQLRQQARPKFNFIHFASFTPFVSSDSKEARNINKKWSFVSEHWQILYLQNSLKLRRSTRIEHPYPFNSKQNNAGEYEYLPIHE